MILITYNYRGDGQKLSRFIESYEKHTQKTENKLLLLDMTITGNIRQHMGDADYEVIDVNIENVNQSLNITYQYAISANIAFCSNIEEGVVFSTDLDLLLTGDVLANNNVSIVFASYYAQLKSGAKIPVVYNRSPDNILTCPFVFIRVYPQEVAMQAAQNNMGLVEFLSKAFVIKHFSDFLGIQYE